MTDREELKTLLSELELEFAKEEDYETAAACKKMLEDMHKFPDHIITEKLQWIKVLNWCRTLGDNEIIDWI